MYKLLEQPNDYHTLEYIVFNVLFSGIRYKTINWQLVSGYRNIRFVLWIEMNRKKRTNKRHRILKSSTSASKKKEFIYYLSVSMSFMSPGKVKSAIFHSFNSCDDGKFIRAWNHHTEMTLILCEFYTIILFGLAYLFFCLNALNAIESNCLVHI